MIGSYPCLKCGGAGLGRPTRTMFMGASYRLFWICWSIISARSANLQALTNPVGLGRASTGVPPYSCPVRPASRARRLAGQDDLLAVRGRVLELADDARRVIADGDEAAAVSAGQQLVAADPEHPDPFAGLDELSGGCVDPALPTGSATGPRPGHAQVDPYLKRPSKQRVPRSRRGSIPCQREDRGCRRAG